MTLDLDRQLAELHAIAEPRARHTAVNAAIAEHLEAIGRLAEVKRDMVRQLRVDGASHADVARLLGVSKGQAQKLAAAPPTSTDPTDSRSPARRNPCADATDRRRRSGDTEHHDDRVLGIPLSHADRYATHRSGTDHSDLDRHGHGTVTGSARLCASTDTPSMPIDQHGAARPSTAASGPARRPMGF